MDLIEESDGVEHKPKLLFFVVEEMNGFGLHRLIVVGDVSGVVVGFILVFDNTSVSVRVP